MKKNILAMFIGLISIHTLKANAIGGNIYEDAISKKPANLNQYVNYNKNVEVSAAGASASYEIRTCVKPEVVVSVTAPKMKFNGVMAPLHAGDDSYDQDATANYFCQQKGFSYGIKESQAEGGKVAMVTYQESNNMMILDGHKTFVNVLTCVDQIYRYDIDGERCDTETFEIPL